MALHFGPARLPRRLLRLEEARRRAPRARQPDPPPDSRAGVVHEAHRVHPHGRHPPLRRHLHRALLHPLLDLAAQVLLPLWLPVHRVRHPDPHLRRDHHRDVLLPALL